jgi:hypothetical protein
VLRIAVQALSRKQKKTLAQETELQTKRTALLKAIQKFRNHQRAYMPGLISRLATEGFKEEAEALSKPEAMKLFLPSAFPSDVSGKICSDTLRDIEIRLRKGQLSESLSGLRRQLRARMYVGKLKNKNGNGQAYWLRSNTFISQVNGRLREHQRAYDASRLAMERLDPGGTWQNVYRKLEPGDIRGVNDKEVEARALKRTREMAGLDRDKSHDDDDDSDESDDDNCFDTPIQPLHDPRSVLGEGYRTLSWIWYTFGEGKLGESKQEVETGVYQAALIIKQTSLVPRLQVFVQSGPKQGQEHCDGGKRSFCWKKRCAVLLISLGLWQTTGRLVKLSLIVPK